MKSKYQMPFFGIYSKGTLKANVEKVQLAHLQKKIFEFYQTSY
jgi:hypothetical protein